MANAFRSNAESLGVEFNADKSESGASTDMGNVSHIVPSIHPIYSIDTIYGNHTKDFTTAAGMVSCSTLYTTLHHILKKKFTFLIQWAFEKLRMRIIIYGHFFLVTTNQKINVNWPCFDTIIALEFC